MRRFKKRAPRKLVRRSKYPTPLRRSPNTAKYFRCSIECVGDILLTGVGGHQLFAYSIPVNYPTQYRNSTGTYGQFAGGAGIVNNSIAQLWQKMLGGSAIFDEYKVLSITHRFSPLGTTTQTSTTSYPQTADVFMIYHLNDNDDSTLLTTVSQALNSGARPYNCAQGKDIVWTFRNRSGPSKDYWYNTTNYGITPDSLTTTQAVNLPINSFGSMKVLYELSTTSGQNNFIGRVYFKWDILFRSISTQAGT